MPENQTTETKNDTLAFIIGGIFILGLVFATYNYFKTEGNRESNGNQESRLSLERLKETLSASTTEDEEVEEEVISDDDENQVEDTGDVTGTTTTTWTATDYKEGDIEAGDYTVQEGDTLWEIAEAVYGNGAMWTRIRDANSGSIDYLPNGQQALIYAGQAINIPA